MTDPGYRRNALNHKWYCMPMISRISAVFLLALLRFALPTASAEEDSLHTFKRQQLTDTYYSEGANAGDINHDGKPDVVFCPYWYEGPTFKTSHEIYPPKPQPREAYADNFFNWVYDFNGDGWNDVLVVGFPGTPAYVYENPQANGLANHWKKHAIFDSVANESPQLVNLIGDERPELVCTFEGFFGYASIDWQRPFEKWQFHQVSDKTAPERFGHGLGVGDVNGDGRGDILMAGGWFEQPATKADSSRWSFHAAQFTNAYGGAEMYAYDVDGDGDNDVIASLAAHDFGLAWFEQYAGPDGPLFRQHLIMGSRPDENRYGVVFSEPHSVALADIDGDGLKDIITGKTYYSHHKQSPMWDAGAVVYWFRLVRGKDGVDWVPHRADDDSGVGRQISIVDVNGDRLPDMVLGGMKGCHVLLHERTAVDEKRWLQSQPKPRELTEQPGMVLREFIYETAPFPECHASTIVETQGRLVAAWFGGTREQWQDVGIWLSRHEDGKWTAPVEVANGVQDAAGDGKVVRVPTWNPVLFQPTRGPLLLFYKAGPAPSTWWGMLTTSSDDGKSWSKPRRLPEGVLGPIKNKPIELSGGELLCPSSTESSDKPSKWQIHFERTRDLGVSWESSGPLNDGIEFSAIQPSILVHGGGKLQAVGRTRQGKVFQIFSDDNGKHWGKTMATMLPNPNSGIDAVTLKDGRHLIVYNHTRQGRSPLNIAVSTDGVDWKAALVLENEPGEYSYPAVIQTADGLVHITYTWRRKRVRHVVVDPAKLLLKDAS